MNLKRYYSTKKKVLYRACPRILMQTNYPYEKIFYFLKIIFTHTRTHKSIIYYIPTFFCVYFHGIHTMARRESKMLSLHITCIQDSILSCSLVSLSRTHLRGRSLYTYPSKRSNHDHIRSSLSGRIFGDVTSVSRAKVSPRHPIPSGYPPPMTPYLHPIHPDRSGMQNTFFS